MDVPYWVNFWKFSKWGGHFSKILVLKTNYKKIAKYRGGVRCWWEVKGLLEIFTDFFRFGSLVHPIVPYRRQRAGCILNRQIKPLSYPFNLFTVTLRWSSGSKIRSFFQHLLCIKELRDPLEAWSDYEHLEVDGSVDND